MNITIKQLRAFLALTETDNFTRAAQQVNLSQPAFSALIATLEQEIGYRLFDRDTRKVQLNADGLHFIEIARSFVLAYDNTVKEIKSHANGYKGKVVLAVLPSMTVQWLPQLMADFHKQHPQIKIELLDSQWNRCLQAILSGQADLALTADDTMPSALHSELLFADDFYLVCHKDHPLAEKESLDLQDLVDYPFIGFSQGTSIRRYTDKLLNPFGINYVLEVSQLTTMMGFVIANYGISIVTGMTLFQFQHQNITIKPFRDISLQRGIYIIKHQERQLSVSAQSFYDFLKNYPVN